jgi:hypothetical protein
LLGGIVSPGPRARSGLSARARAFTLFALQTHALDGLQGGLREQSGEPAREPERPHDAQQGVERHALTTLEPRDRAPRDAGFSRECRLLNVSAEPQRLDAAAEVMLERLDRRAFVI